MNMLQATIIDAAERLTIRCTIHNRTQHPCLVDNRPMYGHVLPGMQEKYLPAANGTFSISSGELLILCGSTIARSLPPPIAWPQPDSTVIAPGSDCSFDLSMALPITEFVGGQIQPFVRNEPLAVRPVSRIWLVVEVYWPENLQRDRVAIDGTDAISLRGPARLSREQLIFDLPQPILAQDPQGMVFRGDIHAVMIREGKSAFDMQMPAPDYGGPYPPRR